MVKRRGIVLGLALGMLTAFGMVAGGPAQAAESVGGPCYVVKSTFSAISQCPPGTYRHQHRVVVRCIGIRPYTDYGNWAGGTSISKATCMGFLYDAWNEQGPDE